jgi:hypothetical protein
MRLPTGIVTVSPMLPEPEAVKPEAPPIWVAVNVTPVKTLGKLSVTLAPVTLLGPKLTTTIL